MRVSIAFVIGAFRYGGAERDLLELLRRLDPNRYECHVLYVHRVGEMLPDFERTGASMRPLGIASLRSLGGVRAARQARDYLRRHQVRILQGFGVYGSFYAAVVGGGLPGLSVVSYEFTPVTPSGLAPRLFQPWYYSRSDVIVGNSDAVLRAISSRWGSGGKRLVKIHNGVDTSLFREAASGPGPSLAEIPAGCPVVGSVGRLNKVKGHDYLIAAWPRVASAFPEARLLLVGPAWPGDRRRIENAVGACRHGDRIVLLGPRADVPRLLQLMDVVVVPSLTEGFSNAVIEAGAAGRPVVATRVGGNPEAIVEGETGLLVPPRDPEALAEKIIELMGDPSRRERIGAAARERVTRLYSVEQMISGYERLYLSLLNGTPG